MTHRQLKTVFIALLLCIPSMTVQAVTKDVGKAIISIGKVFATGKDGKEKKIKRRSKVYEGDTIKVGKKSRLQLRFIDNQLVVLKENTVFRIDEYKFKDKSDKNKSASLSLLKGGMRSVTGLIGKSARDKYKVKTPVATMGVRGTHYLLQVCSGECGGGVKGLVGTVVEGEIEIKNDAGSSVFGKDQFFNVPSNKQSPRSITNPPAILVTQSETETDDDNNDNSNSTDDSGDEGDSTVASDDTSTTDDSSTTGDTTTTDSTFSSGEQTTVETTTGTVSTTTNFYVGVAAPAGAVVALSGITDELGGGGGIAGTQGGNATINLETVNGVGNQVVNTTISDSFGTGEIQIASGAIAGDQGGDPTLGINWGRWNSADVTLIDPSGATPTLLTGLNFIYSDNPTPDTVISGLVSLQTGPVLFDLVNGPGIYDESGGAVTGSMTVVIDFGSLGPTASIIDFLGNLTGADGRSYTNFGVVAPVDLATIEAGGFVDIFAECSGGPCSSLTSLMGQASGRLVGPNAEALIGYFGLSDNAGLVGIAGAGQFNNAGPGL